MSDAHLKLKTQSGDGKVHWRSRRGMLEVELALVPFARERFHELSATDREAYSRLLEQDDWTIHDWLRGVAHPTDEGLSRIVSLIRGARSADCADVGQP